MIAAPILEMWELRLRLRVGKVDLILRPLDAKSHDTYTHLKSLVLVHQKLPGCSFHYSLISDIAPSLFPGSPVPVPALGPGLMLRIIWVVESPESKCIYFKGSRHWSMTILSSKLALPPSSCVSVGRYLSLSVLPYFHLQNEDKLPNIVVC